MRTLNIRLAIDAAAWARYYRCPAAQVIAHSGCGLRVSLPAKHLQRFVAHDGIHGGFRLRLDTNNRLQFIERLPGTDQDPPHRP